VIGTPYPAAVFLSTAAGVLFNFKTYGTLVFRNRDNRLLHRFIAVYAFIYVLNLLALAWARRNGVSLLVAGAVVALPIAAISFALNRRFVYGSAPSDR